MKNPYLKNRFFIDYFKHDTIKLSFGDWNKIFRKDLVRLLLTKDILADENNLENLHLSINKELFDYSMEKGVNPLTIKFYDTDEDFLKIYYDFLRALKTELGFDFYFQATPTIRFHAPNVKNEFHYPIFHSDPVVYGHPPQEINVWLSLTENKHSGFHMINREDSERWFSDYDFDVDKFKNDASSARDINDDFNKKGFNLSKEVESDTSSVYLFDSLCIHTNKPRKEETRISIDVRINPVNQFVSGYIGLGNMKADFKPGGAFGYHKCSIGDLI